MIYIVGDCPHSVAGFNLNPECLLMLNLTFYHKGSAHTINLTLFTEVLSRCKQFILPCMLEWCLKYILLPHSVVSKCLYMELISTTIK